MFFELETDDKNNDSEKECGKIFLNINGNLIFHCTICKGKFSGFTKYENHLKNQHHYGNIEGEDALDTVENEYISEKLEDESTSIFEVTFEAEDTISQSSLESQNQTSALKEDEVDIRTLKQTKNIEVLKLADDDKKRSPRKRRYRVKGGTVVCPVCKAVLSKNSHLKTHLKRHTNERNFKCTICSKEFVTRCELVTHIRSHSGERPYLCTSCGEAFTTASKLKAHNNQKHIRQRDKPCPICNKTFFSSVLLKNHMIVHSDERPFSCEICDSKFKQRKHLRSHLKMHENKKEHVCEMCSARFNQKCNLNSHRRTKHAVAGYNKEVELNDK